MKLPVTMSLCKQTKLLKKLHQSTFFFVLNKGGIYYMSSFLPDLASIVCGYRAVSSYTKSSPVFRFNSLRTPYLISQN